LAAQEQNHLTLYMYLTDRLVSPQTFTLISFDLV
jgi:hypothetical protein